MSYFYLRSAGRVEKEPEAVKLVTKSKFFFRKEEY